MIDFLDAPAHVVACRLEGKVEGADYDAVVARINAALDAHEHISLYFEVVSPQGMTAEAVLKDAGYSLSQIRHLNRFHRVALVTDVSWLRTLAEWENKIIPMVHVRAFTVGERAAALSWASEPAAPSEPGLTRLSTSRADVRAYVLHGPLTAEDVQRLVPELDAAFREHGQVDLLVRVEQMPGVPWEALKGDLARLKLDGLRHVRRYAVVGGPAWLASGISLLDPLLRVKIRAFPLEEEPAAWEWLGAQPAPEPHSAA